MVGFVGFVWFGRLGLEALDWFEIVFLLDVVLKFVFILEFVFIL